VDSEATAGVSSNVGQIRSPASMQLQFRDSPAEQETVRPDKPAITTGDVKAATIGGHTRLGHAPILRIAPPCTAVYARSEPVRILEFTISGKKNNIDSADRHAASTKES